jgi:hypothetical protein
MLPLTGPDLPASLEQLTAALRAGLANRGLTAKAIRTDGVWPNLAELSIDLTGANASRATPLSTLSENPATSISVEHLTISAAPLNFEATPLRFDLRAQNAEFGFVRDQAQQSLLQLTRAAAGSFTVEAERADLEALLKRLPAHAAEKQGAQVKSTRLEFNSRGPRSLDFRAEITAKVFIMSAQLAVTGKLDVDGELNLRAHDLACTGDGVVANLAAGYLRPRFEELEKRPIPLAAFSFAGLKVHDVRLTSGETLRLEAQFGT